MRELPSSERVARSGTSAAASNVFVLLEFQTFFAAIQAILVSNPGDLVSSASSVSRKELEKFFRAAAQKVDEAEKQQREIDKIEATGFNVFHLIEPDENKLSDILPDLLDPKGSHGQGDLF